jgi:hypothetical protein
MERTLTGPFLHGAMPTLMAELAAEDSVRGAVNGVLYARSRHYRDELDRGLAAVGCRVARLGPARYGVQSQAASAA